MLVFGSLEEGTEELKTRTRKGAAWLAGTGVLKAQSRASASRKECQLADAITERVS